MSLHRATVSWEFSGGEFTRGKYSREHVWEFDGGLEIPASPSPQVVPVPYANPGNVDPEEAFVASISSCHMLTFLHVASKDKLEVLSYRDEAVGVMTKNSAGVPWISSVTLHPRIVYGEAAPTAEQERRLHDLAHHGCFIASSVKTEIVVAPGDPALDQPQSAATHPAANHE
jgi:organic hydroperoxide reductase OsmC/OhrA